MEHSSMALPSKVVAFGSSPREAGRPLEPEGDVPQDGCPPPPAGKAPSRRVPHSFLMRLATKVTGPSLVAVDTCF